MHYPYDTESIVLKEDEDNLGSEYFSFPLVGYSRLQEIIIHDYYFRLCSSFELSNLPLLQTLVVGDHSFNDALISTVKNNFSVNHCPSLTTITVGESFCFYSSFVLSGGGQE